MRITVRQRNYTDVFVELYIENEQKITFSMPMTRLNKTHLLNILVLDGDHWNVDDSETELRRIIVDYIGRINDSVNGLTPPVNNDPR